MTSAFDDIIDGVKRVGEKVGKEAEKLCDATRLHFNAADLRRDIEKKYKELGMLVYTAQKKSENVDIRIEQCVMQIDELKRRLDSVNSQSAEKRNRKLCPACGQMVEKTARYCHICGSEV